MFKTQEYLQNKHKSIFFVPTSDVIFPFSSCPSPH